MLLKLIAKLFISDKKENISLSSSSLAISPKLSVDANKRIEEEWEKSIPSYLQDWHLDDLARLKSYIRSCVMSGVRVESMIDSIMTSYSISSELAERIARQETKLLTLKLKQIRYQEAGVNQYTWQCVVGSPKHPVRSSHKVLNGKIFSWDEPPIVNERGERKHPGEDDGCRCTAVPIVKF